MGTGAQCGRWSPFEPGAALSFAIHCESTAVPGTLSCFFSGRKEAATRLPHTTHGEEASYDRAAGLLKFLVLEDPEQPNTQSMFPAMEAQLPLLKAT